MKKEVLINLFFTFLISVLGFLQNRYFVRYMGMETLGVMKLFTQLLAYINIIEMGIGSASAFALYKPLAEKNKKQIDIIVGTIENIYMKIGSVIFILGILVLPLLSFFIKSSISSNKLYIYWILYVLNTTITYFFIKYRILFTANQEYLYVVTIQSISIIFFKILQIICIVKFKLFLIYIIILIADNLFQWIIFSIHFKRKYSYIEKTKERYNGIKSDIKNLFWHKIAGLIVFNTDLLLISKFVSLDIVGIYASYQMILAVVITVMNILKGVLTPKIGRFIAKNDTYEIYKKFKELNILYCFISIFFTFCTYSLIDNFISLWIGDEFIFSKTTLKLVTINLWINLFRWNLEMFKWGAGFFSDIESSISEAIINFVISIILGLKLGLDGIIIGTIVSNILVIMIYKPILVFKRCFEQKKKEYIKLYSNYLGLIVVSIFCLNFITKPFVRNDVTTWVNWIIYAMTISIITLIILFIIFLSNRDFRNIIKKYILAKNNGEKFI